MRSFILTLGFAALFLGGCAATPVKAPNVLSGEAPVGEVIGKGDAVAATGDYRAAAILYKQALSQEPSAAAWYRLGMAETYLEEPEQAMWAFSKALKLDPEHRESLQRVALYHTGKGLVAEAGPYLQRLLAIDPDNWLAHNALGVLADLEQRFDEAADHYTVATELNPGSAMLWNNLGYSRYLSGRYELARQHFEHALRLDGEHVAAHNNLALVFARQSRYEEALAVVTSLGGEAEAYTTIGYLAYRMGEYGKAEVFLTEAIRRSPTYNRLAHQNLAAVRDAKAAEADSGWAPP